MDEDGEGMTTGGVGQRKPEVTKEDLRSFIVEEIGGLFPQVSPTDENVDKMARFLEGPGGHRVKVAGGTVQ